MWSFRTACLVLPLLALAACGFQLRTTPQVPPAMARTFIAAEDTFSLFYRNLRRELESAGVELVDSPADATAVLSIFNDETDQRVLSVSARNVPREYEVFYTVSYGVQAGGEELLAPRRKTATRDYTYDETKVLGKAREEELLREAIARDLAQLVVIQLSSL